MSGAHLSNSWTPVSNNWTHGCSAVWHNPLTECMLYFWHSFGIEVNGNLARAARFNEELRMTNEERQSTPLLPEGGVPNGRGGRKRMVRPIYIIIIRRRRVAYAAYFSYHLPLRELLLPEGGEFSNHCQLLIVNCGAPPRS